MKIEFVGEKLNISKKGIIKKAVKQTLKELDQPKSVIVCVNIVNEQEMQELNKRTRNIDKVTDVLSFPSESLVPFEKVNPESKKSHDLVIKGKVFIGDMALCMSEVQRQATEYCESENKVLARLVIHSILHLLGFDHIEDKDYEIMKPVEDKILAKVVKK